MDTSTFTPFPQRQFTKQQVEALFGPKSDAKLAQKTKTENPNLYSAVRQQAILDGLAAPIPTPYAAWRMPRDRKFTDREIEVRSKHSEQECREMFGKSGDTGGVKNVGKLYAENPAAYLELREAAVSYGIIPESQPRPVNHTTPKPATEPPQGFVLSDAIADKINLPRGTRVTTEQFAKITTILNEPVNSDGPKE